MLQNCAQSNCRIIPKKLRDMKREEICRLLADKVNKLKNKENGLSELLPDVRLLYGETPFARTPVMYEPGIIILNPFQHAANQTEVSLATDQRQ